MATTAPASANPFDITSQFENIHAGPPPPAENTTPATHTTDTSSTPNTSVTNGSFVENIKNTASSTMSSVANHPTTQQVKDTVVNGPVGQSVQQESAKTSAEFKDLADAKVVPSEPAATGQPLTHYHSLFYRLLSWKNPRATGIVFATLVAIIFASRYVSFARYTFKALYTVLGITALAEGVGKATIGHGFATQLRPKKYYTIRKESLERFLDDVEQFINFGVIEAQRIVFVENIWVTGIAFVSSFISYFLIKLLPFWGLTLLATAITFLAPLVYISNQELIDGQLNHAGNLISSQANQVRDIAAQNTRQASESLRTYAGEYSQKAQELIVNARGKVNGTTNGVTNGASPVSSKPAATGTTVKTPDFPVAPKTEPASSKPIPTTTNTVEPITY